MHWLYPRNAEELPNMRKMLFVLRSSYTRIYSETLNVRHLPKIKRSEAKKILGIFTYHFLYSLHFHLPLTASFTYHFAKSPMPFTWHFISQ